MSSLQGQEYGFGSGAPFLSWNPVSAGKKGTDVLGRSYGSEPWVMREALDLMGWEKKKQNKKTLSPRSILTLFQWSREPGLLGYSCAITPSHSQRV